MRTQNKLICCVIFLSFLIFSPAIGLAAEEMSCIDLANQILVNSNSFELGTELLSITSTISGTGSDQYCEVNPISLISKQKAIDRINLILWSKFF